MRSSRFKQLRSPACIDAKTYVLRCFVLTGMSMPWVHLLARQQNAGFRRALKRPGNTERNLFPWRARWVLLLRPKSAVLPNYAPYRSPCPNDQHAARAWGPYRLSFTTDSYLPRNHSAGESLRVIASRAGNNARHNTARNQGSLSDVQQLRPRPCRGCMPSGGKAI